MKQASGQMSLFDLGMPCGRTSPEHSLPTKAKTSVSSLKSFAKSKTKAPMFLDLRTGSGNLAGVSWETGIPWLGASSMLNFGECPNVVEESGLWQILEDNVPQRYYLSERACVGVLRRAERRGKELKPILKLALEQQIERWRKYGSPLPVFGVDAVRIDGVDIYNGTTTGKVSKTITSAATDSDHIPCVICYDARGNGDGKEREFVVCETLGFNPLNGAKAASNAEVENGSPTLRSSSPTACVICFSQDAYDKYEEAQHAASLKASGGNYGGGSENLVCAGFSAQSSAEAGLTFNENLSPTLQVGKCAAVVTGKAQYVVRRLTPLECCRLQGMPDGWCADVPHSDAQEYRMWGNGMALPNALYIMEGLVENDER